MRPRTAAILFFVVLCWGAWAFLWWREGTPYQTRFYSPNGRYYVQKYENITLNDF